MKLGLASDSGLQQSGELFRRHARRAEDRAERALRQVPVAVDGTTTSFVTLGLTR